MTDGLQKRRRRTLASGALCVVALTGCGHASGAPAHAPQAGSYPIATPPAALASTQVAGLGRYQVVSAGDPVRVDLPGARVLAQLSGPDVTQPSSPKAGSAPAVATISLRAEQGTLVVPARSFLALDEQQSPIRLRSSATSVTVSPGHPAVLRLAATFPSGHATVTWQPTGHPVVTWDFVVELD